MQWVIKGDYLGLPFKKKGRDRLGIDCYGLVRLVLHEQLGILFPAYTELDSSEEYANSILRAPQTHSQIKKYSYKDAQQIGIKPFDVAVIMSPVRQGLAWVDAPIHMGIFVSEKALLHIREDITSTVDVIPNPLIKIDHVIRVVSWK